MIKINFILKILLCLFLLIILAQSGMGMQVEVIGDLPDVVEEGELIEYELYISGIPQAAKFLSIDTDLSPMRDEWLYNFTNENISTRSTDYVLDLSESDETVHIKVQGTTPVVTDVVQFEDLTLSKMDSRTTGYAYYRFNMMDSDMNPLRERDTNAFSVHVPLIEEFDEKVEMVDDPFLRNYLRDLFNKGLVNEANELADYLNSQEDVRSVPLIYAAIGLILMLIIGIIAGIRLGNREEDDDYE
ncbi:hypothetical protein [Methanosalsum natronophilum]|uniref:hypothetical protein n=1 Tax=Methanosalsum natronophilum TaxID=768733 RepID=UPI002169D823|nr:hypothetical protein [Methanosalsum natronophilum]MCS3923909.1 hypothetical protein [Methanosalsum natronophilum]